MVLENFNMGLTALRASQIALNVTGHNIANVNTPGYTRQRAEFVTSYPQNKVPGQLGTGVLIEEINRLNDAFTQMQLNVETRDLGQFTVKRQILQQLEDIFNEPTETGLQAAMSEFFTAWHTLSESPEDYGARALVVEKGVSISEMLNSMSRQLSNIQEQIDESIRLEVDKINDITSQIAELNDQIAKVEVGGVQNANDLRDTRDRLILELNEIIDVNVRETQNNTVLIEARGGVLVAGVRNIQLTTGVDENGHVVPVIESSGARILPESGKLKGYLDMRDDVINEYADNLDTLASTLIESVNRIHSRGTPLEQFTRVVSLNGQVSGGIVLNQLEWDYPPKSGSFYISAYDSNGVFSEAQEISINPATDTLEDIRDQINAAFSSGALTASLNEDNQLILQANGGYSFNFINDTTEAGDSSDFLLAMGINTFFQGKSAFTIDVSDRIQDDYSLVAAGKSNSPGDNRTALDIASLQNAGLFQNNSTTFEDIYSAWVSNIGTITSEALVTEDRQTSVISLLNERLAQTAGVSLDEEATNLLRFQRAYQAAARIVTIANTLFDTLLNL